LIDQSGWAQQVQWPTCPQGAGKEAGPGHPDYKVWFMSNVTCFHIYALTWYEARTGPEDHSVRVGLVGQESLVSFIGWRGWKGVEIWLDVFLCTSQNTRCFAISFC
jgi:hypothetical protein